MTVLGQCFCYYYICRVCKVRIKQIFIWDKNPDNVLINSGKSNLLVFERKMIQTTFRLCFTLLNFVLKCAIKIYTYVQINNQLKMQSIQDVFTFKSWEFQES